MEGGTKAPVRHPIPWQDPAFTDGQQLDAELRRVFDICHGCRRCFNLCDSFLRLFELIDGSETGELDAVGSDGFASVVDACTLCDLCFMTKCPYVPPHEFNIDFPHLMLRARAAQNAGGKTPLGGQTNPQDRSQRPPGGARGRAGQLGHTHRQLADAPSDPGPCRHSRQSPGAQIPPQDPDAPGHSVAATGARTRAQSRAICHVFRQSQQP